MGRLNYNIHNFLLTFCYLYRTANMLQLLHQNVRKWTWDY